MNDSIRAAYEQRTAKTERVDLPGEPIEWHVREFGATEDIAFNKGWDEHKEKGTQFAYFAVQNACDASGKRLFADSDLDWVVERIPGPVLRKVWLKGGLLNGYVEEEDAEKN